jgi:hypothetical protein
MLGVTAELGSQTSLDVSLDLLVSLTSLGPQELLMSHGVCSRVPEGFIQSPDFLDFTCQGLGSLLDVHWSRLASGPADAACCQSARSAEGAIVFGGLLEGDAEEEVDETDEEEEPGSGEGKAFGVVREKIGADLMRGRKMSAMLFVAYDASGPDSPSSGHLPGRQCPNVDPRLGDSN